MNSSSLGYHSIHKYKLYDLITMNESELRFEMRDRSTNAKTLIKMFAKKICQIYLLTMGKKGALIYNRKKQIFFRTGFWKK